MCMANIFEYTCHIVISSRLIRTAYVKLEVSPHLNLMDIANICVSHDKT